MSNPHTSAPMLTETIFGPTRPGQARARIASDSLRAGVLVAEMSGGDIDGRRFLVKQGCVRECVGLLWCCRLMFWRLVSWSFLGGASRSCGANVERTDVACSG